MPTSPASRSTKCQLTLRNQQQHSRMLSIRRRASRQNVRRSWSRVSRRGSYDTPELDTDVFARPLLSAGGLLKDDTDMTKLNLKEGQMLMVLGTAGELPKGPLGPINFIEDMTDSQLASATKQKVSLASERVRTGAFVQPADIDVHLLPRVPRSDLSIWATPVGQTRHSKSCASSLSCRLRSMNSQATWAAQTASAT